MAVSTCSQWKEGELEGPHRKGSLAKYNRPCIKKLSRLSTFLANWWCRKTDPVHYWGVLQDGRTNERYVATGIVHFHPWLGTDIILIAKLLSL